VYNTSHPVLLARLLPHYLRGKTAHLFLLVGFVGIQKVRDLFDGWREATDYKLKFAAQVVVLEQYLNELFDPSGSGITVTDGTLGVTYLYNVAEAAADLYLYNMAEDEIVPRLQRIGEYVGNYVVTIPSSRFADATANRAIHGKIDFFNPAGMSYLIRSSAFVDGPLAVGEGYDSGLALYSGGTSQSSGDAVPDIPSTIENPLTPA